MVRGLFLVRVDRGLESRRRGGRRGRSTCRVRDSEVEMTGGKDEELTRKEGGRRPRNVYDKVDGSCKRNRRNGPPATE